MISILDHIEYLMTKHDCVIVPGLGAFISQYSVSKNMETGIVESVKRNIAFNRSVDYNDGLLINSLMRRENISFERAKSEIDNYVRALFGQLKYEGEVPVGRLGFFSSSNGESLEFFPFTSRKANNEYFGLMTLSLKPLVETIQEEIGQDVRKRSNVIVIARRVMQVAASITLLIVMALMLSTPIIEDKNQNYANFNAFAIKADVEEQQNQELYIAIPVEKETEEIVAVEEVQPLNEEGGYCLVVASLATEKQVEKYMKENPGADFRVTKFRSNYRVYVARGTYDEMNDLRTSRYADTKAWVTRI